MVFGLPKVITSDQGSGFRNSVNESLMDLMGIDHRLTTPYHPQVSLHKIYMKCFSLKPLVPLLNAWGLFTIFLILSLCFLSTIFVCWFVQTVFNSYICFLLVYATTGSFLVQANGLAE